MHSAYRLFPSWRGLAVVLLTLALVAPLQADNKEVLGYLEEIRLMELGWVMEAKLDTGATTSSLDAREIEPFEKDDEDWVRFKVVDRDTGTTSWLERPVARTVGIKRHGGKSQTRYVVDLTFCIGNLKIKEEVSLTNREGFNSPVLVGRNHMAGRVIVDPAEQFSSAPDCLPDDTVDQK